MKTTEDFLKELNTDYDLSMVEYKNNKTKVKVRCKKHNYIFEIRPDHLKENRMSCKYCLEEYKRKKFQKTKEQFIKEAKSIHGDKYDYSLVNYVNNNTKVKIICPIHGAFEQTPNKHIIRKHGCDLCGGTATKSTEQFIEEAKSIHGDKYNYSLVNYVNNFTKVKIICPIHGIIEQLPMNHLSGYGCKYCKNFSSGEISIKEYFNSKGIVAIPNKTFDDLKDKHKLSYDFYIEEYNLLIEYNGEQHYRPIEYYGGREKFKIQLHHDWLKRKYARKNNINLLVIKYNEDVISCLESKLDFLTKK